MLAGPQVDLLAVGIVALAVAIGLLVWFRSSPRAAVTMWLVTIAFVPVWFAVPVVFRWMPATVVGVLVLLAVGPGGVRRVTAADAIAAAFFLACVAPVVVGGAWTRTSVFVAVTQWGLALALGRLLPRQGITGDWIGTRVALVMGVVAAAALIEFAVQANLFVRLAVPGSDFRIWGTLQERGGVLRAEGAFGHSIALGCSVAMAVPLALAARIPGRAKAVLVGLLLTTTVVTFSRVAMLAAGLGVVLSALTMSRTLTARTRAASLSAVLVLGLVAAPWLLSVFQAAGEESAKSAAYRGRLLSLVPSFEVFGFSSSAYRTATGDLRFSGFKSIDSALILLGLTYGWIALILAVLLLALVAGSLLTRRASPPGVAVVAQVPALMSVALITQYAMLFWFVAGLALAAHAAHTPAAVEPPQDSDVQPEAAPAVAPGVRT